MTNTNETYEEYARKRDRAQRGLKEEDESYSYGFSNVQSLVTGILVMAIVAYVSIALISQMQDTLQVEGVAYNVSNNLIEQTSLIADFFPGTIIVGAIVLILGTILGMLRISYNNQDEEEKIVMTERNPVKHRQTYLEYVKEQLAVERMMR